jgi:glycosyltransferase involved in cell wall biosynthesis
MRASIIVCTRNRAESLKRCLASIAADPSTTDAEVIVVDNASRDNTGEIIKAAMLDTSRQVRCAFTAERGHARARNTGVREAQGSLLLFTDDDVQVQPGWIDALVAPFTHPSVAAVGGRIIPTFQCDRPDWLTDDDVFRPLTLPDYGLEPFEYGDGHFPVGANMGNRANLLPSDPFNVTLGHTGTIGIGFEEFAVMERLGRDHLLQYVPNAVVWHMLDAKRVTLPAARRTLFHMGFGLSRYQRLLGETPATLPRRLVRSIQALARVRSNVDSDVVAELHAWHDAGQQLEWLFGARAPWLANWCAVHLAPSTTTASQTRRSADAVRGQRGF